MASLALECYYSEMVGQLRQIVTVQPGGVVRIQSDELRVGTQAEVVVITDILTDGFSTTPIATWKEFIGIGANSGRSVEEIDSSIRELRDEWQ